jgi:hypothetical protein
MVVFIMMTLADLANADCEVKRLDHLGLVAVLLGHR